MRNVKVATIQPRYLGIPDAFNYLTDSYRNNPEEIMENHIIRQMDVTLELLDRAGREGCDIVTTCEDASGTSFYNTDISETNIFRELVTLSYPVLEAALSEISRKYSMYIIGCYNKIIDNKIYNTATIFDRKGSSCGAYRKTHLPPDEKWQISQGEALDVFELDFGRIGVCICYDIMFPECVEALALKGAEVVFHPTVGYGWYDDIGEATLRTRANDNSVYIVTSKNYVCNHAGKSSVVDFWGQVMVDAGFYENVIVSKTIDLDQKKTQPDWYNPTYMSGTADVAFRMRRERRPELYSTIVTPVQESFSVPTKAQQLAILDSIRAGRCHW